MYEIEASLTQVFTQERKKWLTSEQNNSYNTATIYIKNSSPDVVTLMLLNTRREEQKARTERKKERFLPSSSVHGSPTSFLNWESKAETKKES